LGDGGVFNGTREKGKCKLRIFIDTEFTGLHQDTTLISIGLVDEHGQCFYAEATDFDNSQADEWIHRNVISNLCLTEKDSFKETTNMTLVRGTKKDIYNELSKWISYRSDGSIEVWSDCLAYDWVLFCELFGGALNIPRCVYYIPFDICTVFKLNGIDPDINREEYSDGFVIHSVDVANLLVKSKHNSLWDAWMIKGCYDRLMTSK